MEIREILDKMTLEEKIALGSGKDFWHLKEFEQYGIPSVMVTDGPHGLRKQAGDSDMIGLNDSVPATCFPTASLSACSFNEELMERVGEALGREGLANDVAVVLGPGANIKRDPLCGRNFEYFSEDPVLSGKMAAAEIRGIEKTGCGSSLKHYALNNQETKRFSSDSVAGDLSEVFRDRREGRKAFHCDVLLQQSQRHAFLGQQMAADGRTEKRLGI